MKIKFFTLLIIGFSFLFSCGNNVEDGETSKLKKEDTGIYGTWTLFKEDKNGKKHDYLGKPTAESLTLKENGYFIYFDKITDEKMNESGVDQIQERYKGQFESTEKLLTLNHFEDDSLIVEKYTILKLSGDELTLKDLESDNIHYFKK